MLFNTEVYVAAKPFLFEEWIDSVSARKYTTVAISKLCLNCSGDLI